MATAPTEVSGHARGRDGPTRRARRLLAVRPSDAWTMPRRRRRSPAGTEEITMANFRSRSAHRHRRADDRVTVSPTAPLAPGRHRFQLVVVDDSGNASEPACRRGRRRRRQEADRGPRRAEAGVLRRVVLALGRALDRPAARQDRRVPVDDGQLSRGVQRRRRSTSAPTPSPGRRRRCARRWPPRRSATTSTARTRSTNGCRSASPRCSARKPRCGCRRARWPTRSRCAC